MTVELRRSLLLRLSVVVACVPLWGCGNRPADKSGTEGRVVRCAVIGGMMRTGLWNVVSARFEEATGYSVEVVAQGPKAMIAPSMQQGRADLLTMHASDTVINLVADGYAVDPQPWLRNDVVIAGPPDDPARIRGLTDAVEAIRRIADTDSAFVAHTATGTQDVLNRLLAESGVQWKPGIWTVNTDESERRVLTVAARNHAYTLVGRIPFLDGKMERAGLDLMVQGDPRLRRPYVVVVANPERWPHSNIVGARALARFLRRSDTQAWLAEFGRGKLDDRPLFFPVWASTRPAQ